MIGLSLNLIPTVTQSQWERFWSDSLSMINKFPIKIVRLIDRKTPYGTIRVFSQQITGTDQYGEYLGIAGDLFSMTISDEVRIYRDIEYYKKRWHDKDDKHFDPLFCTTEDEDNDAGSVSLRGVEVFRVNTMGRPYHLAVEAVIMLGEYLFMQKCLGWEKMRPKECEQIHTWLSKIFNAEIPIPTCLDASRLWNRIEGVCGDIDITTRRFKERFLGTKDQEIHRRLAESRERTMNELAGFLQYYNSPRHKAIIDITEAFLLATDDLDAYLDLIQLRNSLATAANKERKNDEQFTIFELEDVMKMLIINQATTTKWQCEELHEFKRWTSFEGDVHYSSNTSLIKSIVPRCFEFYCSPSELLETFCKHEPSKKEIFEKALEEGNQESKALTAPIEAFVRMLRQKAVDEYPHFKDQKDIVVPPDIQFEYFVQTEARIQSGMIEELKKDDVKNIAIETRELFPLLTQPTASVDFETIIKDKTGKKQLQTIVDLLKDYSTPISEETWEAIENSNDVTLLNLFIVLLQISGKKQYEKLYATIIHCLNQPKTWNTFKKYATKSQNSEQ
ncbi:MAG: hypothetical protein LBQ66_06630 [Planctomycetaceae bacterium]|nr:hypothetical protein [Planctomycetaceae bacterium]